MLRCVPLREANLMDHYHYSVADPLDPRFQASATVQRGELLLTIRVRLESGERAPALREAEQFRKIVTHFARRFHSIDVSWTYGDDLAAFNRAVAAGAAPEEAALRTWTGQQAGAAGYSRPQIRSLERRPGRYSKVAVSFSKPESSTPGTKPE
jgi:hypothetical protein